jgi:hypothetical protein
MRKLLLASVATLGTGSLMGAAFAQAPAGVVGAPSQGQQAWPAANPTAYVNNNNNYQAPALPGALANPTPGTIVIHINGKVQTEFQAAWTSVDSRLATPATPAGVTGSFPVKLEPLAANVFARLYFGGDAMATNGLRYGAAIELRQNFIGTRSFNDQSGASGASSASTVYVRRAFTYVAGENWGIVRAGMADGLIGIFDNGVTTGQFGIIGELNGGDTQNMPGNVPPPFFFLSQAGNEYDVTKFVYLSPQIAGFDFGLQYAPTTAYNGYGLSTGNPFNGTLTNGTGVGCSVANSGCPTLSAGPGANDGSHALNWTGVGARYQGAFGGLGVLAYAAYEFSGHSQYTGPVVLTTSPTGGLVVNPNGITNLGVSSLVVGTGASAHYFGKYSGAYQGLNFGSAGLALTYAGFTVAANAIGGRINGQLGLVPDGGVNEIAYTLSVKYVYGPWTIGWVGEAGWFQGSPLLAGISTRRGRALATGVQYTVAPGFQVGVEYGYSEQNQGGYNFVTGAVATGAAGKVNNSIHGQSLVFGSVVNF